jgi:hypothetical protein
MHACEKLFDKQIKLCYSLRGMKGWAITPQATGDIQVESTVHSGMYIQSKHLSQV